MLDLTNWAGKSLVNHSLSIPVSSNPINPKGFASENQLQGQMIYKHSGRKKLASGEKRKE